MAAKKENVGPLLDGLYIEMLSLIEQQSQCRVNMEKLSNSGQLLLAKTRYIQGSYTVGASQIPTENSADFQALCRVDTKPNMDRISQMEYTLSRQAVNKSEGFVEPMNWFFGALPPNSLRTASTQFQKCIELAIESANLQRELVAVMDKINKLKTVQLA